MTGLYWHRWDEFRTLLLFTLKQWDNMLSLAKVIRSWKTGSLQIPLFWFPAAVSFVTLETFTDGAPFTIQRFCEVLLNPRDRYPTLDKVALAFEKLLLVTSTIPPSPGPYPEVPSVPAPPPAQDEDQKPLASPQSNNTAGIISSGAEDILVVADEQLADAESRALQESREGKDRPMDVDLPQLAEALEDNAASEEVKDEPVAVAEEEANSSTNIPPPELVNTPSEPPPEQAKTSSEPPPADTGSESRVDEESSKELPVERSS